MHNLRTPPEAKLSPAVETHNPIVPAAVLLVSSCQDDHARLTGILKRAGFRIHSARTRRGALGLRGKAGIAVVLVSSQMRSCCWRDLWRDVQRSTVEPVPHLIVCSARADDDLWAQVLELGGHDVLAKPFHAQDVVWAVTDAAHEWMQERELLTVRALLRPAGVA